MSKRALFSFALGLAVCAAVRPARADVIDDLQPGHWYEVPSSHLAALDPCPTRDCSYSAVEGVSAVIDDWSGGAYDTARDRLIVWGGGHGGYAGNEIYVFSLTTLAWERVSDPSDPVTPDVPYAPDGGPTSRHTYNYVQYLAPPIDRFCSFGGAGFYQSGQTGTTHVDCFDFDSKTWETQKFADTLSNNLIGSIAVQDPSSGHVWQHGGQQSFLVELDPGANAWTAHGDNFSGTYLDYYKTADIDPKRKKLVAAGNGEVWSWDLGASGDISGVQLTTSGDTSILGTNSPGFVYDPVIDEFVAWGGGAEVYTLDPDSLVWAKLPPDPTNTVVPTAPNGNGTFGRFRYSPARNVFVLVNAVDEDVYVYRLSPGGGPAVDAGVGGSSGSGGTSTGGSAGNGNVSSGGTPSSGGGASGNAAKPQGNDDSGGCSCHIAAERTPGLLTLIWLLGFAVAVARKSGNLRRRAEEGK